MGDNEQSEQDLDVEDGAEASTGRKRARSLIEFPYTDLERAIDLAAKLLNEGGQAKIEQTQLAVAMDQSATGGTFRGRLSAAKMFGLVDSDQGQVWLEPLGLRIIDDATTKAARAEAFLNVPLYKAMFDRYNGYALPPPAAIERQMESLGVPFKQKERARQAFSSSAEFAGYIASNGRFSKPTVGAQPPPHADEMPPDDPEKPGGGGGNGGDEPPLTQKPLEYQLIDLMSEPDIEDEVRNSIWNLVQYLTKRKARQQDQKPN